MPTTQSQFQFVPDEQDDFLALFPHRFDYIWATFPEPAQAVEWRTETRFPLSDRLIQQGSYLYGVRFGAETRYCLLDIDIGSIYHPDRDPFAISRLVMALEPLGLVSYVACISSTSNGLHLYFPFQQAQNSWKLAIVVSTLLENAGFKLKPGQLEVFPDPKPYNVYGKPSLFNAHRLPLQIGSYLLNADFQPIWGTQQNFVQQWQLVQQRNQVETATIHQQFNQIKRNHYQYSVSTKAEKFIHDLNTEIEPGWTDYGQTNYLLGRIAMREYIFHHVLTGEKPLEGEALVDAIVDTAQSLPGYQEFCRHRHEIYHRAREWATCVQNSRYFHYGDAAGKFKPKLQDVPLKDADLQQAIAETPTWNQHQLETARERIKRVIAELLERNALPANTTARFNELVKYGIGGGTLYKHRDLWHPNYLTNMVEVVETDPMEPNIENPPHPPTSFMDRVEDCYAASSTHRPTSLLPGNGRNSLDDKGLDDSTIQMSQSSYTYISSKCNFEGNIYASESTVHSPQMQPTQKAQQITVQAACKQRQHHLQQQIAASRQIARMQQFLDSGDPILVAEAIVWAQTNPNLAPLLTKLTQSGLTRHASS